MLSWIVIVGRHPVRTDPGIIPPVPASSFALFLSTAFSPLFVFNQLRTLSFSVAHLSRISPIASALFQKKPGVGVPMVQPIQPGTSLIAHHSPRDPLSGVARTAPVSSFTASLTQKQGGSGYWSYHCDFVETDLKVGHYRGRKGMPASEGGHYNGKRARCTVPLQIEETKRAEAERRAPRERGKLEGRRKATPTLRDFYLGMISRASLLMTTSR